MKKLKTEDVASIGLTAEMFMYGTLLIDIEIRDKTVFVQWVGVSDGGMYEVHENKVYSNLDVDSFLEAIEKIKEVDEKEDYYSVEWELTISDKSDKIIKKMQYEAFEGEALEEIISCMEEFFGDKEPTSLFSDMLGLE